MSFSHQYSRSTNCFPEIQKSKLVCWVIIRFRLYDADAKYHNMPMKLEENTRKDNTRILTVIHYSISGSSNHGEVLVRASMQSKGLLALVSQRALNGSPKNRVPLPTRLYSAVGTNSSSSIVSPSPSSSFKKSSPPYSRPKPSVPRASAKYRPQELDEAARRRLTKRLYIPLPTAELRAWFIRSLLEKDWLFKLSEEDTNVICRMSEGYLGSDMKNLVKDASTGPLRDALRQGEIVKLQKEDLRTEIVKLQKEEDLRIVNTHANIRCTFNGIWEKATPYGRILPVLFRLLDSNNDGVKHNLNFIYNDFKISAAGTCLGCFLAGLSLLLQGSQFPKELSPALALTGILVYTGSFSLGMGGLPWVLSSLGCSQVRHLIYNYTSERISKINKSDGCYGYFVIENLVHMMMQLVISSEKDAPSLSTRCTLP
ncbi:hypothetical protein C5167_014000 [Papaver somniferum]|uniref:Uncharacterized protein n=1 Tax=Papaver somniferum TaxID=3469 RepID=A0A4Y7J1X3_PAPSO|nr:hypothetical protein C5167_014000 [Papaver somniferum]